MLVAPAYAISFQAPTYVNDYASLDNVSPLVSTERRPSLAAAGDAIVVAWSGSKIPGTGTSPDFDIAVSRRLAGGPWAPSQVLNSWASTDAANMHDNLVSVGGHDNGTFLVAWEAGQGDILGTGVDDEIFFARSTDSGATWSAAAALNSDATTDNASDGSVRIAGSTSGTWIALWERDVVGVPQPVIAAARSTDDGASFGTPVTVSSPGDSNRPCALETNGSGVWISIWVAEDSGFGVDKDVLFSRSADDGVSWSPQAPMNLLAASDGSNDDNLCTGLVYDADTNLWMVSYGPKTRTSSDDGATWSTPAAGGAGGFSLAGTAGQWVFASWLVAIDGTKEIVVRDSTDAGATWSADMVVPNRVGLDDEIPVVVGHDGEFFIVWAGWDAVGGSPEGGYEDDILFSRFPPMPVPALPLAGVVVLVSALALTPRALRHLKTRH